MKPQSLLLTLLSLTLSTTPSTSARPYDSIDTGKSATSTLLETPDETDFNAQALSSMVAASTAETSDPNTCPPSHPSKQCCTSVSSIGDDLTSQLGELVPIMKDVKVSSLVGLECDPMDDDQDNSTCAIDVMCCDGKSTKQSGSERSLFKTCRPFDEVLASKKKTLAAQSSSAAAAAAASSTPTSRARTSSSAVPSARPSSVVRKGKGKGKLRHGMYPVPTGYRRPVPTGF